MRTKRRLSYSPNPQGGLTCSRRGAYSNWNGVVVFTPKEFLAPNYIGELQEIVKRSTRLSIVGSCHSMNGAVEADFRHGSGTNEQHQPAGNAPARSRRGI